MTLYKFIVVIESNDNNISQKNIEDIIESTIGTNLNEMATIIAIMLMIWNYQDRINLIHFQNLSLGSTIKDNWLRKSINKKILDKFKDYFNIIPI